MNKTRIKSYYSAMAVNTCGNLRMIIGPMFSGKSSLMTSSVERYSYARKKCIIIKHLNDQRFGEECAIRTHDGFTHKIVPVVYAGDLNGARDSFENHDVIGIDEIQFFAMYNTEHAAYVVDAIEEWVTRGKTIICAGLDTDWERAPFCLISQLIGRAHSVTKLLAICADCGADALFTARTKTAEDDYRNPVGGKEKYIAVCRECYNLRRK